MIHGCANRAPHADTMATTYTIDQIAITLAALAYQSQADLEAALGDDSLATQNEWTLRWGQATHLDNLAYVVGNDSGEYVLAVRGTIKSIVNIFEDVDVGLTTVPGSSNPRPMVSRGWADAVHNILHATPARGTPGEGTTLQSFLGGLPENTTVYVTGHSLGASTAQVLACWIKETFQSLCVEPRTFANPTAGTADFAAYFADLLPTSVRWDNANDNVPRGYGQLEEIRASYASTGPLRCPDSARIALDALEVLLDGTKYFQAGTASPPIELPIVPVADGTSSDQWYAQMGVQHSSYTYLHLLGAPLVSGQPATPWPPKSLPYA